MGDVAYGPYAPYDLIRVYQIARQTFALRVFLLATVFILLAATQWISLLLVEDLRRAFTERYYISFFVFFCAFIIITVFILFERVRFTFPLNWILTIFIVECVIWGLARAVAESRIDQFGYCFSAVILVVILMLVIGACLPYDLTKDVVFLFFGAIFVFIGAIFFVLLHVIANVPYAVYVYLPLVVLLVLVFIMYHSQTICGGRFAEMRIGDYLLGALLIFNDFVILFVLTFYLASSIQQKA